MPPSRSRFPALTLAPCALMNLPLSVARAGDGSPDYRGEAGAGITLEP